MGIPSLWMESQVLCMDRWMKVVVNGSFDVNVSTKYLKVIMFIIH